MLVQQTIKLFLPSVARDARVEKDSFGKAEVTYTMGRNILSRAINVSAMLQNESKGYVEKRRLLPSGARPHGRHAGEHGGKGGKKISY